MNQHNHNHAELLSDFLKEQQHIFDSSSQAVYAFLDDGNKVCNAKFATLLEYGSPEEWAGVSAGFTEAFVDAKSQHALVSAFQGAMTRAEAATISVTWKKKSGSTIDTTVILVPVVYKGHVLALHFVS